jgi:hypothetical protein
MTDIRGERLQIMLSPSELSVVDDFQDADPRCGGTGAFETWPDRSTDQWRRSEIEPLWNFQPRLGWPSRRRRLIFVGLEPASLATTWSEPAINASPLPDPGRIRFALDRTNL